MITLNKLVSAVRDQFTPKQGKDWVDNFTSPEQVHNELRFAGIGAGAGALGGALTGLAIAEYEISKVPIQTDTEHWKTPQLDHVQIGMIPKGYYSPGDFIPYDDHRTPSERVYRDNPNTQPDGSVTMQDTEKTFKGHGAPVVAWHDNSMLHHSMSDGDYSRYTTAVTHQQFDHTEHWSEQVANPTTYHSESTSSQDCVSSYKSDGTTGQDCHTVYGSTQVADATTYHSEDRSRDVYRTVTDGYNVSYSERVTDKTVGHFTSPSVNFENGISVGADMAIGLGIVGTMMHLGINSQGEQYFTVGMLLIFIAGFAMSAGPLVWTLCSEVQPLKGRDFGIGASTFTNWVGNMIVGATFLSLLNGIGNANTFWLYAALNVVFIGLTFWLIPETKGVTLEQIESNLMAGKPLREIGQ